MASISAREVRVGDSVKRRAVLGAPGAARDADGPVVGESGACAHAKRLAEWTLWLGEDMLAPVPHRLPPVSN